MQGLYIHIPFCVKKCAYCDFASVGDALTHKEAYLRCLIDEMQQVHERYGTLHLSSIFIGGGTPSLLTADEMGRLLNGVRMFFSFEENVEITTEANPGTLDMAKLNGYRKAGINRLSLGAQAAQSHILASLGRIHVWEDVISAVHMARDVGIENINLDLMVGLPHQTTHDLEETLHEAIGLEPTHISAYDLIVEEGTPFASRQRQGTLHLPCEDTLLKMDALLQTTLTKAGYARYEVSNYAKEGYPCAHNMLYWQREPYVGIGCAAHSFMQNQRFANTPTLSDYLDGTREVMREMLSKQEAMDETLMLGLRLIKGVSLEKFYVQHGVHMEDRYKNPIERMKARKLLTIDGGYLRLTSRGQELQNQVLIELLSP